MTLSLPNPFRYPPALRMKSFIASLAGLAVVSACHGDEPPSVELMGNWTVSDVFCASCASVDRSDIGKTLRFTNEEVADSISGGGCADQVG